MAVWGSLYVSKYLREFDLAARCVSKFSDFSIFLSAPFVLRILSYENSVCDKGFFLGFHSRKI